MKKLTLFLLLIATFFILVCKSTENAPAGAKEESPAAAAGPEKIDRLISAKTDIFIQVKSIQSFYSNFQFNDFSFFGMELGDKELGELKKNLKFNVLSLKELEENGFNTNIPLGVGLVDFSLGLPSQENNNGNQVVIFIPARDSGKILNWLLGLNELSLKDTDKIEGKNIYVFKAKNNQYLAVRTTADYFIMATGMSFMPTYALGEEALAEMRQSLINTLSPPITLSEDKYYRDVAASLGQGYAEKDAFFYINMQTIFNRMAKVESMSGLNQIFFQMFGGMLGLGFTADYSGADLIVDSVMHVEPDSLYAAMYKDAAPNKDIIFCLKERPVILSTSTFNLRAFYEQMIKQLEIAKIVKEDEFREQMQKLNQQLGIDFENDIIDNFAGGASLAVAPLHATAKLPQVVLTLNLKDPDKTRNILPKFESLLQSVFSSQGGQIKKENIAGNMVTKIQNENFSLYIGIAKNNLIISLGRDIYEQLAGGSAETGFLNSLQGSEIAAHLKKDLSCVYIDFPAVLELADNIPALKELLTKAGKKGEQVKTFLSTLNYLLSYGNFEGNALTGRLKIKTSFNKSFMQSLLEFIHVLFPFDKDNLAPPDVT